MILLPSSATSFHQRQPKRRPVAKTRHHSFQSLSDTKSRSTRKVMIKLLGASALALTLSMPAAHAAHRYRHVSRMSAHLADRHRGYGARHLAWDRTGWRHRAAARRNGMRDAPFGDAYADAGRRDDARYESRPSEIHSTELHAGGVG